MKKIKQKSKAKKVSFILGLPFTLLALAGGVVLVINGCVSLSANYTTEGIAMLVGGTCMAILGILHLRSGVFMTICGIIWALAMAVAFVVLIPEADGTTNSKLGFLFLLLTFTIGILELIGGIISIRNTKNCGKPHRG